MRIESTDARKRKWEYLCEATGENTKSKALDRAVELYLRMAGGTTAYPTGTVEKLLQRAEKEGSLTTQEIAEILDTEQLPVDARVEWTVGTK